VSAVGGQHRRGEPQPVENQVRPVPQQPAVLDRRRFALFAVRDHGAAPSATPVVAHCAQFHRERECRAATALQAAELDFAQQLVGEREALIAAQGPVGRVVLPRTAGLLAKQP